MIDKNKVPKFLDDIISTHFSNLLERAEYEHMLLVLLYGASMILCHNRVRLRNNVMNLNDTFPNLYILSFSRSGGGKDLGMRTLMELMEEFISDCEKQFADHYLMRVNEVEKHIEEKGLNGKAASDYRKDHAPRELSMKVTANSSVEGFFDVRAAFEAAGFGCTSWNESEIFDVMKVTTSSNQLFIEDQKKCYDHGDTDAKVIKSVKNSKPIKGVPNVAALHGSLGDDHTVFKDVMDRGLARRCMVFVDAENKEFQTYTPEELLKRREEAVNYKDSCKDVFTGVANFAKRDSSIRNEHGGNGAVIIEFTHDVVLAYLSYKQECEKESFNLPGDRNKGVRAELEGRHWRAVKLSGVLAAFEGKKMVDIEIFSMAVYLTNYYGEHFARFYFHKGSSYEEKLEQYIEANPGITRTELCQADIVHTDYNKSKNVVDDLISREGIQEHLALKGKYLVAQTGKLDGPGRPPVQYFIYDIPEHQEAGEDLVVKLSQAPHNVKNNPRGYQYFEYPFKDLHQIVNADKAYSAANFKDLYRSKENRIPGETLLILDVDNEVPVERQLTIENAKEKLKDYTYLIATTKSHNKEKHGEVRERYRIILPVAEPLDIDEEMFKQVTANVVSYLGLEYPSTEKGENWVDVPAFGDPARFYFGAKGEHWYNDGKLFNWKVPGYKREEKKHPGNRTSRNQGNHIFDKRPIAVNGRVESFESCVAIARLAGQNKSVPCNCPFHEDKSASAHFRINEDGNFQFNCSSSICNVNKFYNL